MSNGEECFLLCICAPCDNNWRKVQRLAALMQRAAGDDTSPYYDKFERAAAAVIERFDFVPVGVGKAIVAGYRPYIAERFAPRVEDETIEPAKPALAESDECDGSEE